MTSPDFSEADDPGDIESFGDVLECWARLPLAVRMSSEEQQRLHALTWPSEEVEKFRSEQIDAVWEMAKAGKHFDALRLLGGNLARIAELFQEDDAVSARAENHRMQGYTREHLATFGDYSRLPHADPVRRMMFRGAAAEYMKANIELGCKTDAFMRVAESCFGAGLNDVGSAILGEVMGPNVQIIGKGTGEHVALRDLIRRATEVKTVEGSAGALTVISGSMPNPSLN